MGQTQGKWKYILGIIGGISIYLISEYLFSSDDETTEEDKELPLPAPELPPKKTKVIDVKKKRSPQKPKAPFEV